MNNPIQNDSKVILLMLSYSDACEYGLALHARGHATAPLLKTILGETLRVL